MEPSSNTSNVYDYFDQYCNYLVDVKPQCELEDVYIALEGIKKEINLYLNFRDHLGVLNDEDSDIYKFYNIIKKTNI